MTGKELLNANILKTPIIRDNDDFSSFAIHFLHSYLATIRSVDDELKDHLADRIPVIQDLCHGLIKSIESYYLGSISSAYQSFCTAISGIGRYLWLDNPDIIVVFDEKNEKLLTENFFKVRAGSPRSFSKKEMFIRPFEQREFINTYRYSIPGLPCLYLSSNMYTAWNELDCPDINTLQISRFVLDKTLKKLRFGFNIEFWKTTAGADNPSTEKLYDFLTYFPLYAMCNIKVKNPTASFKPEYVFPQFLMQWVKQEHRIDVVEYSSTKIDSGQFGNSSLTNNCRNLAIPAQTIANIGPCTSLQQKIKLTDPISWQGLKATYPNGNIPAKNIGENMNAFRIMRDILQLELIKGKPTWYGQTIFGQLEDYIIDQMEPSFL